MADKPVLFPIGSVVMTMPAFFELIKAQVPVMQLVDRHRSGDFGQLCAEDVTMNRAAIQDGGRVVSSYQLDERVKVWVITEADRKVTTILLPREY